MTALWTPASFPPWASGSATTTWSEYCWTCAGTWRRPRTGSCHSRQRAQHIDGIRNSRCQFCRAHAAMGKSAVCSCRGPERPVEYREMGLQMLALCAAGLVLRSVGAACCIQVVGNANTSMRGVQQGAGRPRLLVLCWYALVDVFGR